ncbi:MAG: hypothetical protein Q6J44_03245, partial [Gloeomargarita sp. DG02_4_bins_56]
QRAQEVLDQLNQLPRQVQLPPSSKPLRPPPQPTPPVEPPVSSLSPPPRSVSSPLLVLGQIFFMAAAIGLWVVAAVVHLAAPVGVSLLLGMLLGGWVWFWGRTWLRVSWLAGVWLASFMVLAWVLPGLNWRLGLGSLMLGLVTVGMVTLVEWLRQSLR